MQRVSPEQYSLLRRNAEGKPVLRVPGTKRARVKKRTEDLPENQLEKLVTDYLRHHGWTCTKQHAGFFKKFVGGKMTGFTIGEKGQADWRAERPVIPPGSRLSKTSCFRVELFYFETKAPGKKPEAHQQLWLDRRQLTGITTGWFSSFDSFVQWYRQRYGVRGGDPPPIRESA